MRLLDTIKFGLMHDLRRKFPHLSFDEYTETSIVVKEGPYKSEWHIKITLNEVVIITETWLGGWGRTWAVLLNDPKCFDKLEAYIESKYG